jgi:hypothetical protein
MSTDDQSARIAAMHRVYQRGTLGSLPKRDHVCVLQNSC